MFVGFQNYIRQCMLYKKNNAKIKCRFCDVRLHFHCFTTYYDNNF